MCYQTSVIWGGITYPSIYPKCIINNGMYYKNVCLYNVKCAAGTIGVLGLLSILFIIAML
jgi:hypothetical protein